MACSCIEPYATCPETTNFAHICRIVVDVLRDILWQVLTNEVTPTDLPIQVRKNQYNLKRLDGKLKAWLIGIPPSSTEIPSSEKFDVSSLYTLIRNLCSTIPSPTTKWGNPPPAGGMTLGDDIERVREFRNTLYGHATQAKIDTADYNNICINIIDVVSRFDAYFSVNCKAMKCNFTSDIHTVLTSSTDKALEDEYIAKLKEIVVLIDDVQKQVDGVGHAVGSAKEEVNNLKKQVTIATQNVRYVKKDIDTARQGVNNVNQEVGTVKDEVRNIHRKVCDVDLNVSNVKEDLLNVKQEVPKINQEVVDVKQEVGSAMQKVCDVIENVSDVRQEVGHVRQEVGSVKQDVINVKQDVTNVTQILLDLKQDVSTVNQEFGSVKQEVGSVNQEVGYVKQGVGNVYQIVGDVKQNVGEVTLQVDDVNEAIDNVRMHVGDVKQHLHILQKEAGVKQQVGDLNTNLEILHDKVDVLKKDIAEIKDMLAIMPASVEKGGTFKQGMNCLN
ncbi:hypothetical protein ACJMK2_029276 [Sinanodonta woodiana]|uniref:DZIP3-like HEPN domain-containing protein n=1 Tax=Sinanodonta woodiana TaxID=1069815 RepID=A0ABD3XB62_SINWO